MMTSLNAQHLKEYLVDLNILDSDSLPTKPLFVAVSGGLDSMVVLRLMLELRYQFGITFAAVHINHGISQNSQSWQAFVQQFCDINEITLTTCALALKKVKQRSLEQIARDARYQAFANELPQNAVILTGHHQQDQMETFLLRLTRGSGSRGLSAMSDLTELPNKQGVDKGMKLCRPLLSVSKQALTEYAEEQFLNWIEDESNNSIEFDRNFIRHKISPQLTQRWPHIADSVFTSTQILANESKLLEEYLTQDLARFTQTGVFDFNALNIGGLTKESQTKQIELVRLFLSQQLGHQPSRNCMMKCLER